ncbi:MAG TPA: hypothetical protein VGB44_02775 [Flavobacterium sp.]
MKKIILLLLVFLNIVFVGCSDNEGDDDVYVPISPVVLDVTQVPYQKLSDYKFFVGALKNQEPALKVLPYRPASELFSDYAHKKRFVWMPAGTKATHNGPDNTLEFPIGAALIKTFYYDDVLPALTTKIIETRLLIKIQESTPTNSGWKTINYIWNEEQTEAYLDTEGEGIFVPIEWMENGVQKSTTYKVPAFTECATCHKLNPNHTTNGEVTIPIGPKPQNLNHDFNYGGVAQNQLQKWIDEGYLEDNLPANISSTVDWRDTSKTLELRARSYIDINCAHCHRDGAHCDYVAMRFNFSNTDLSTFGVCMIPSQNIEDKPHVISAGSANDSELMVRISSTDQSVMMPIIGRTVVHEEGVALMNEWINSLNGHCE